MLLTLEVISANGDALGSNRSKTIGPDGAQIGRSKESDWVINDPYISRVHARIRCVSGAYYVEGTGRNPLALNDPSNVVPNNQPQLLRSGDRFFLDQYEIRAIVEAERKPAADPFGPADLLLGDPTVRAPVVQPWHDQHGGAGHGAALNVHDANASADGNVDPLKALGISGGSESPRDVPRPVEMVQRPVIEDHFSPPPVQPATRPLNPSEPTPIPVNAQTQKIPAEYIPNRTHLGQQNPPPLDPTTRKVPQNPPPNQNIGGGGRAIPDRWNLTAFNPEPSPTGPRTQEHRPQEQRPVDVRPVEPRPVDHRPEPPRPIDVRPVEPRPVEPRPEPPRPMEHRPPEPKALPPINKTINRAFQNSSPQPPPVEQTSRETRSLSLEQVLASAGVTSAQMSPELAQELGEVLRIVVQGVMDVLQSRAEIKSQLRMNMTRMQPAENNPLKFSPNVEAALHTLLVERNRGYLPTVRAFHEALSDIRNHQIAVLQGIRTAFHTMLEQFNPVRLEQEFERHNKRGLLNVGAKTRFRDAYVENFERMTRDPDESFRRLFGEYFAQAYEDQMDQLKAAARNDAR